ncbi:MAG: glycosyltransferase family 4 protein [Clostridiales bacterium]|nr:glycosyltransferase family 4 protein [Clostridiales bacterium]
MKKVLFTATITKHFQYFHQPCFRYFHDNDFEVSTASSGEIPMADVDKHYDIAFERFPLNIKNYKAYKQLKRIIDSEGFQLIHCHTPVGGVVTRLAALKARKNKTRVIYTAHGFHFYKGASKFNWCVYYPIELLLSFCTDCLITINEEDYVFARKHLHAKDTRLVNGVGYDTDRFYPISPEEKSELRKKYGFSDDEKILIYVAELNENKNQGMLIRALKAVKEQYGEVKLLLAGHDNFNGAYQKLAAELGVDQQIMFLGFCGDTKELVQLSDIGVVSSLREGLPVNVMESLACGLPVVAADNRGHRVLIKNGENGFIVEPNDWDSMARRIIELIDDGEMYKKISASAVESAAPYSKENVIRQLAEIYNGLL